MHSLRRKLRRKSVSASRNQQIFSKLDKVAFWGVMEATQSGIISLCKFVAECFPCLPFRPTHFPTITTLSPSLRRMKPLSRVNDFPSSLHPATNLAVIANSYYSSYGCTYRTY